MSPYLCRRRLLIPMARPGDSMSGSHYAELIQTTRAGIERWTDAVFGVRFISGGKVYVVGSQTDSHSCGVCVINGIDVTMHGAELFTRPTRSRLRLQYFIRAATHLLQGQVHPLPAIHHPICSCSPLPSLQFMWMMRPSPLPHSTHRSSSRCRWPLPRRQSPSNRRCRWQPPRRQSP